MFKEESLTLLEKSILFDKNTEKPFTGKYCDFEGNGTYLCKMCGLALFRASSKFHSGCGWPSFDHEIEDSLKKIPDTDGLRTEILCNRCSSHLGHVFLGEGFTNKNIRHCVNSIALDFVTDANVIDSEEIILAAGCFWGVEYYLNKLKGVILTEVGYSGGKLINPNYRDVCDKNTEHLEVVRVIYNKDIITLTDLIKYFFEIHDFTQKNGQGPDIGSQYLSAIFCYDQKQREIAGKIVAILEDNGFNVTTKILPVATFWSAEDYHQKYYEKNAQMPYCHVHKNIF